MSKRASDASPSSSSSAKAMKTSTDASPASGDSKRLVLLYSGGLDTSVILAWMIEQGYTVIAYCADVGQQFDNLDEIKAKAMKLGAEKCYIEDLREEFVTDFVFPYLRSGSIYEGRYLLGTSIARPVIAKRVVEIAQKENCKFVAHGATGKGNDQVRFELSMNALDPSLIMVAPWRNPEFLARFEGRRDLLEYAEAKGVPVEQTKKASYSIDENLFHTSYESGVLEDPSAPPPVNMFKGTKDPVTTASDTPIDVRIEYRAGNPVRVTNKTDGTVVEKPLELFLYCNKIGQEHGVGRVDIVENRFVGIKSRGVYETPGGTILYVAHQDLEGITVDRGVLRMRDMLAPQFAELAYNGFWYSPEMDFVRTALDKAQELVDGFVDLTLYKGNVIVRGRGSAITRYSEQIASMDDAGDYNPIDAQGFIRINSLRLRMNQAHLAALKQSDPKRFEALHTYTPKP